MKKLYFVNWSVAAARTTETKVFSRLKDARLYTAGKKGYITRYTDTSEGLSTKYARVELVNVFGGFDLSAHECMHIKALTR